MLEYSGTELVIVFLVTFANVVLLNSSMPWQPVYSDQAFFPCECLARETSPTLTLTLKCRLLAGTLDTVFKVWNIPFESVMHFSISTCSVANQTRIWLLIDQNLPPYLIPKWQATSWSAMGLPW